MDVIYNVIVNINISLQKLLRYQLSLLIVFALTNTICANSSESGTVVLNMSLTEPIVNLTAVVSSFKHLSAIFNKLRRVPTQMMCIHVIPTCQFPANELCIRPPREYNEQINDAISDCLQNT